MEKIYIRKKNQPISGPYQISDLPAAGLRSSDKIWYEGLPTWIPIGQVDSLKKCTSKRSLFKRVFGK